MVWGMAADPSLGTRIRRARERKRMSQQQLADALGVSRGAVNAWENDRARPASSIGALEDILGIGLDGAPAARVISPQLRRLIRETLPGDPEAQRRVTGLLEGTLTWPGEPPAEDDQGEAESPPRAG
jgi:transcriptional regulator with XRE-family HTH domain